jgi:hypothetical protein
MLEMVLGLENPNLLQWSEAFKETMLFHFIDLAEHGIYKNERNNHNPKNGDKPFVSRPIFPIP